MKKILNVERVVELAEQGKALYCSLWRRHTPAAFMASWQARLLHSWIKRGYLFEYQKIGGKYVGQNQ